MSHKHSIHEGPAGYRLIDETTLIFLWCQTALIAVQYLGIGRIGEVPDARRVECVMRLGQLYLDHSELFDDRSTWILEQLMIAANDLVKVSGH